MKKAAAPAPAPEMANPFAALFEKKEAPAPTKAPAPAPAAPELPNPFASFFKKEEPPAPEPEPEPESPFDAFSKMFKKD